jgi:hypothetical protein
MTGQGEVTDMLKIDLKWFAKAPAIL